MSFQIFLRKLNLFTTFWKSPVSLKTREKIKNVINLDTNIQIKLDFINSESADKFVEKGWDEEKQMYYYLVYFNKEHKV